MNLSEAQRLARNLEKAEKEFDASWSTRWRAIVTSAVGLTLPISMLIGYLSLQAVGGAGPAGILGLAGSWAVSVGGIAVLGPLLRRRAKRQQGMETMDARVLLACADLEGLSPDVTEPLERSLDAYLHISRVADDPVWKGSGVAMPDAVQQAGRHLLNLMDWARRLSEVSRTIRRLSQSGSDEVRMTYNQQLARFHAAASAFQSVEVQVARAYVALSGAAPGQSVSPQELSGLGSSFAALSEVLSASEAPVTPSQIGISKEEETVLRLGRG